MGNHVGSGFLYTALNHHTTGLALPDIYIFQHSFRKMFLTH